MERRERINPVGGFAHWKIHQSGTLRSVERGPVDGLFFLRLINGYRPVMVSRAQSLQLPFSACCRVEGGRLSLGGLSLSLPPFSVDGASVRHHARFPAAPLRSRTVGFPESGSDPRFII
jgi:hypothetical protein